MPLGGDTQAFARLTPDVIESHANSSFANPNPSALPTLGTDPALGLAAIEAYYAPAPKSAKQSRKEGAEFVRLIVGWPLLAGAAFYELRTGSTFLGVILLLCLAFATLMIVAGFSSLNNDGKEEKDKKPGTIGYLEREGILDEACTDFPLEPNLKSDEARFGNHFVFIKSRPYRIYRYSEFARVYLKKTVVGNSLALTSLEDRKSVV